MKNRTILTISSALAWAAMGEAQTTQVDLRNQAKSETKQIKTGTTLPATCSPGDVYLKSDAPLGSNLYTCMTRDTWTVQVGAMTIQNQGATVGTYPVINFLPGTGVIYVFSDAGARVDIANTLDTATVPTRAEMQSGRSSFCESVTTGTQAFTCSMAPALTNYSKGMVVNWRPNHTVVSGSTTLSIDGLPAVPVKLADGVLDPTAGDVVAGRMVTLWHDGTVFRLSASASLPSGTRPACNAALRGRLWYSAGGAGIKDEVAVCAKDSADQYGWRTVY
jgi:hypothetical protein